MKPYHDKLMTLIPCFKKLTFTHVPRKQNKFADSLDTLASMIEIPVGVKVRPLFIEQRNQLGHCEVNALDEEGKAELPWFVDVQDYIAHGSYPEKSSRKDRRAIRRFAA